MPVGLSTSNLYPLQTEQALSMLTDIGADALEVFVNTRGEVFPAFAADLRRRADDAGIAICSLHPYTSAFEPYLLFSAYQRRFEEGLTVFDELFEAAAVLGASYVILHGDRENAVLPAEEMVARYERLYDCGQRHGVTLLQENVVRFRACQPAYVRTMRQLLGAKAQFVLDLKQCRRANVDIFDMIDAMGDAIRHVHVSDYLPDADCLVPGKGREDFRAIAKRLQQCGFQGTAVLELYRQNFTNLDDLRYGVDHLHQYF